MKVRICPQCGKHNLENAWQCANCYEALSMDTITEVEVQQYQATQEVSMGKFFQANFSEDRQHVQELFIELSQFIYDNIFQKFGVGFDVQVLVAEWMAQLQEFFPPNGCLVLAAVDSEVVGVGCLKSIDERAGQIKHFYVRPQFRRRGLGRKLLENLVEQSVSMGHTVLRLDTGWFMEAAQALYRSFDFTEIAPYPETEVPKELHPFWIFLEKDLTAHI